MANAKSDEVLESRDGIIISGKTLSVEISKKTGRLKKIICRAAGYRWNDFPGRLSIRDEYQRCDFDEDLDRCELRSVKIAGGKCLIEKRFSGAEFTLKEEWRADGPTVRWSLYVCLDPGKEARSLRINQLIPWRENNWGTGLWAASPNFPSRTDRMVGCSIEYGDGNYGAVLPLLTLYRPKDDVGLSVAKPLGLKIPRLRFSIPHWHEAGPEAEFSFLGLREERPAHVELLFTGHEGCWRPGLRWFSGLYPEYFNPPNPDVRKLEGGYIMTNPFFPEAKLKKARQFGVTWAEVHEHFPLHGNYVPKEKAWSPPPEYNVIFGRDPKTKNDTITPALINQRCREAKKNGIAPLLYFQCAGDGYIPYVTKKFPDSIAVAPSGKHMPSWINCRLMNSDPSTSFGKEILDQISRLYRTYPDIGGVFLDQLCYGGIDVTHDDGVTMRRNKPGYVLSFCYWETVKALADEVHRHNQCIIANGPYDVEVQRYVDGHMAEGVSRNVDLLKYLCIQKPLLFLSYYKNETEAEEMFQNCLLAGASYSISTDFYNDRVRMLIDAYLPLIKKLEGRKWLLEPNPLNLPAGNQGNIFTAENKDIIVTLVKTRRSIFDTAKPEKAVEVGVTISAADRIRTATCRGAEYRGAKKVRMKNTGKTLTLTLPVHGAATVITLHA